MSKETRSLLFVLGLPLAAAALLLAAGVVLHALRPVTAHADGAGVSGKEGFAMTTVDGGGGTTYLCVSTWAPYQPDGQTRQFLTFYEIKPAGTGRAELHLVGSRCVDFDRGFELLNFKPERGLRPSELEKELNKGRRPAQPQPDNRPRSNND
ncbi:MAG: hypothetical protein HS108_15015 [Planctomycetes bacterium]|nr:hypothetical protein [Planctomycetota bacterium]MCL4729155.1 hypothetical protein [Planctomycetota bacterium]